jgi:tetratricopeptide (TPR) repeat protein
LLRSAVALFENDRYAEAAALFRYILVFRQRAACIWAWLGRCHEHSEQFEVAESIYQAALAVVPPSRACELRELALRVRWLRGLREAKVLGAGR